MKKLLVAAAFIFTCFTTSVFSLEWGGLINNMTGLNTTDLKELTVTQSNGAFFWLRSSLNKDKTLNISTEAVYKFNMLINDSITPVHIIDLNLLKLSGILELGKNTLYIDGGRYLYSDIAGAVFSQNSDGVGARLVNRNWKLGAYAGYTGLLNRLNVGMYELLEPKREQFYDFCYGYVPVSVDFTFTNLGENHLGAQVSYFLDTVTGKNHKGYFDLVASGPISNFGSYNATAVLGTENFKNLMLYSSADLSLYVSSGILASLGFEYTSGDNGVFSMYTPVSYKPIHESLSVYYGADVLVPRLTGMFMLGDVCITANEKFIMSFSKKGFAMNGFDTNVSAVYNIFSDLQVSCILNAYADMISSENNNFSVMLNASFTF